MKQARPLQAEKRSQEQEVVRQEDAGTTADLGFKLCKIVKTGQMEDQKAGGQTSYPIPGQN